MTAFPQFLRDLDSKLRHFEFNVNRTDGGLLADWLGIRRHTVQALVLPTILAALLVAGPTPTPGWRVVWGFAAAIWVFFALSFLMRTFGQRGLPLWLDLAGQLVVLGLLALGVWILAGPEAREFQGGLYQHVLIPFWGIFWLAWCSAPACQKSIWRKK